MEKSKALSSKEKSANPCFFLPLRHHIGNPVPEFKFTQQGKSKGLEKGVCMSVLHFHAACSCCISVLLVYSGFLCRMCMMHVPVAGPCFMSMLHIPAFPCWVSILHVNVCTACPYCTYVHAACPYDAYTKQHITKTEQAQMAHQEMTHKLKTAHTKTTQGIKRPKSKMAQAQNGTGHKTARYTKMLLIIYCNVLFWALRHFVIHLIIMIFIST
jgi:hypothetical protein